MTRQSVVELLHSGQRDLEWFNNNLSDIKLQFNNSFIAFNNQKVIDSDKNLENLMKKLRSSNVDTSSVFIEFVSNIKTIL